MSAFRVSVYMDKREVSVEELFYRNMNTLALGINNLCIDVPPEHGTDVNKYNATLGHKANHGFEPNIEWHIFSVHPVLGTTKILVATKDIVPGTELTVDYGYDTSPQQPAWYVEQWEKYLAEKEDKIVKRVPWVGVV